MERRKFFGLAPFGLLGVAALAKGETPTEPTGSITKKAMQLTIKGPDGKEYHPLVVAKDDDTYEEVPLPKMEFSHNRLSVNYNASTFGIGTSASKMKLYTNNIETFKL
jgi:hypothetical protein